MTEPRSFRSVAECLICEFYTCNLHLRCAVHPYGVEWETCPDYTPLRQPPAVEEAYPSFKENLTPEKE